MHDAEVRTVLVADDDEGRRARARLTLAGGRFEVIEAADARSALLAIAARRPQVILVEAQLPGAGGLAIARSVKAQPETADVRVVVTFDRADPVDERAGRESGVDAFLARPFGALTLLQKVVAPAGA